MDVYLEVGAKKAFAVAVDWPGWARGGRDADSALAALLAYGERYQHALRRSAGTLRLPTSVGQLRVVESLDGNATTDFGAPGVVPELDKASIDPADLERLIGRLQACWKAFTRTADNAEGVDLAPSGPRGGGRSLVRIREHVAGAEAGYLNALGGKGRERDEWTTTQKAFIEALRARARGELPDVGPRGGRRWPAPFAIRRSAWHALDHTWEIEDRVPG